jgi:G:T-mismatch repair DNA endonuclease (very short patch repair protein)
MLCLDCRVFTGNCQLCGKEFTRRTFASYWREFGDPKFCSRKCRNISNAQENTVKKIPCPICGTPFKPYLDHGQRKKYCSPKCGYKAQALRNQKKRDPIEQAIKQSYASKGADHIAKRFNVTVQRVQQLAYNLGITLDDHTYYNRVHEAAREYMLKHNPMKRKDVVAKVREWQKRHPDLVVKRSLKARSHNQKKNPSGLELQLHEILNDLGMKFEIAATIKPKFVVDVRINNLIIQADGDYWHGHPRFEPLTKRQIKQQKRDAAQDKYLRTCGYIIVRIWESDMCKGTVETILRKHDVI